MNAVKTPMAIASRNTIFATDGPVFKSVQHMLDSVFHTDHVYRLYSLGEAKIILHPLFLNEESELFFWSNIQSEIDFFKNTLPKKTKSLDKQIRLVFVQDTKFNAGYSHCTVGCLYMEPAFLKLQKDGEIPKALVDEYRATGKNNGAIISHKRIRLYEARFAQKSKKNQAIVVGFDDLFGNAIIDITESFPQHEAQFIKSPKAPPFCHEFMHGSELRGTHAPFIPNQTPISLKDRELAECCMQVALHPVKGWCEVTEVGLIPLTNLASYAISDTKDRLKQLNYLDKTINFIDMSISFKSNLAEQLPDAAGVFERSPGWPQCR